MNIELLISKVAKHISLSEQEIKFFTSLVKPKSLKKGEFLLREGDVCKHESFVIKGDRKSVV